jgi:flagellar assembly protein FliH
MTALTTRHTPFSFDRVFASDGTVLRDGQRIKRMLTLSEAQEQADAAAAEALKADNAEAARAAAEALKVLSGRIQAILTRMEAESEAMRADAARLAVAAARQIAGAALAAHGEETVLECARSIMDDLRAEPRIAVRVTPALADTIAERLHAEADHMGLEGAVIVRADEEVATGDCVLEWRSGSIERTASDIETRIAELVERWLATPAETPATPDELDEAETLKELKHG